jgi:hypothetical protein
MAPPSPKRPRGRPPKPEGRLSPAEIQRAYRERKKAATPDLAHHAELRGRLAEAEDQLRTALIKLQLRDEAVARLEQRNAYLEGELRLLEQHHTIALKDKVVLQKQLAEAAPGKRRR